MSVTTSDTKILQKSCGQLRNSVSLTKMHVLSLTGVPAQSGSTLTTQHSVYTQYTPNTHLHTQALCKSKAIGDEYCHYMLECSAFQTERVAFSVDARYLRIPNTL